jgi:hypothetical protein
MYRPVDGVDWDLMRSIPEFGFVGNDVEAGRSGGSFDEVLDGPGVEDDEGALVMSIAGMGVAGGTRGEVVWSALATGRVKTGSLVGSTVDCVVYSQLEKGIDGLGAIVYDVYMLYTIRYSILSSRWMDDPKMCHMLKRLPY